MIMNVDDPDLSALCLLSALSCWPMLMVIAWGMAQ